MKESLKLLWQRERREVLGRNNANMWLLVVVITATFLSIAFSNASMDVLSIKMDDPFTNWVSMEVGKSENDKLTNALNSQELKDQYKIKDYQYVNTTTYTFCPLYDTDIKTMVSGRLTGGFLENFNSDLVRAILDEDNLIAGLSFAELPEQGIGLIVTGEALEKFKYDLDHLPSHLFRLEYSENAFVYGHRMHENKYAPLALPILAVVKRLPSKWEYISTSMYENNTNANVFNLYNLTLAKQLNYFVREDKVDEFKAKVAEYIPDSLKTEYEIFDLPDSQTRPIKTMAKGQFMGIYPFGYGEGPNPNTYVDIAKRIANDWSVDQAVRVYLFDYVEDRGINYKDNISVNFERLDSIRPFETYMLNEHGLRIDMEQINAKENFNAVSVMANILSWAMIVFSIVCIILFIVNMLQSYFQKVKRNMGTFKAFGIGTGELIGVYVLMLFVIVMMAILMALLISWGIELIMPCLGWLKEGKYPYLSLWSVKTFVSIGIMVLATVVTVYIVMRNLLQHTPGDLIYDR